MDGLLRGMAEVANGLLQGSDPRRVADTLSGFAGLLNRHLEDAEDIEVLVILNAGFDG